MAMLGGLGTGCHTADPQDGTAGRLVSWRLETESGDSRPLVLGIYDRALDTPCRFVTAEDGTERCLPFSEQAGPLSSLFADERCEHMLFQWVPDRTGAAEKKPAFLSVPSQQTCPRRYEPRTARPLDRSSIVYERTSSGECRASTASVSQSILRDREFLVAGDPVPLSRFAAGTRVRVPPPSGQRLAEVQIQSPDGGPFTVGLHDQLWQRACAPQTTGSADELLCWPPYAQDTQGRFLLFAEQSCTTQLSAYQPIEEEPCEEPVLVRARSGNRRIGERWTAPHYTSYDAASASCMPAGASVVAARIFAIGPALGPDAVAALRSRAQGTGALRRVAPATEDGRAFDLPIERWNTSYGRTIGLAGQTAIFEDAAAKPCTPYRASDGTVRCLPLRDLEPLPGLYFADAACTQPLASCTDCAGKDVLVPIQGSDPFGAAAVHEFGPRFTGQAFATDGTPAARCAPYTPASGSGIELRALGARVPWDRYPKLAEWRGAERVGP